jgi:hypothetical protein
VLLGGTGSDSFTAGGGKDLFIGGGGVDTAIFHDAAANYTITQLAAGVLLVTENGTNPTDGAVVLDGNFTSLHFADKSIAETASATASTAVEAPMVTIQAKLDSLESLAAGGYVASIAATDGGTPVLTVSAAQFAADKMALDDLSTPHAVMVRVSGDASQHNFAADDWTGANSLQFDDQSVIVAAKPGPASAVTTGNITELYSAVLAREPDIGGLAFYQNFLLSNPTTPLQTFADFFLNSTEYKSSHSYAAGTAGDTQFIEDSYQNLLHRTPSSAEVNFYLTNVMTKPDAHALMLVYFSASPEFLSDVQITASNPASAQHWLVLV